MKITKTLQVTSRSEWRRWLRTNHASAKEIWLVYYKKGSGKKRIPYNDAVEEALCFGWIDGIIKGIDEAKYAQRFTPRRRGSTWSAANRERVRRLIRGKKMTPAGLSVFYDGQRRTRLPKKWKIPADIESALKSDRKAWRNFNTFPLSYRRVRIGWIDMSRKRPKVFEQRLRYFIRMTAQGRQFGMVR